MIVIVPEGTVERAGSKQEETRREAAKVEIPGP
jgi:hypothetical protein